MRFTIFATAFVLAALSFAPSQARAQVPVPSNCQFQVNPHSYACTRWTFDGNQMFPLVPMNLNTIGGTWRAITFADPTLENDGPEFAMFVNQDRPTVPMGVLDKATGRDLGDLVIDRMGATQTNWRGLRLDSNPGSLRVVDAWTLQFTVSEAPYVHSFSCRDFTRNGNEHLLCSWDILMPNFPQWQHKGFFGYLR